MAQRIFSQNGSIIIAIFAAIAAVGVVGVATMNTMKGPVRSMHNVTQKTIAENNMIAAGKLALMAAINQENGGDCDEDGTIEPLPFSTTGDGPHPIGGGYLPQTIGTAKLDPWGNEYGYCVWDHGTSIHSVSCGTDRLRGAADENGIVIAVMSSGPDRVFQTSCGDAPDYVIRASGSDDIVLAYSYAEAATMSGGLWNIKAGAPETAEISKSLEVRDAASGDVTFALDSASGIGDFIGIVTGSIASKTSTTPVRMAGGLKVDSDANVATCDAQNIGTLRYHHANGLEVCDGTGWQGAGGGAVPAGTIAAFASNTCPSGWSEYSPARGRFLRGRDPTGTNDVVRNAGSTQDDMNKAHTHSGTAASAGAHTHSGTTGSAGAHTHKFSMKSDHRGGGSGFVAAGSANSRSDGTTKSSGAHTHTLTINSAGAHTHDLTIGSEGGVESRPKNVAVTFCQYNGGVPLKEIAGLGNLHDVVLSAPVIGQVLTFDGTNWINAALTSPPTCNGANQKLSWSGSAWSCVNENDPKVGALANNSWCHATGGQIVCDRSTPLTSFTEVDPKVGATTSGRWCRGSGSQIICDQAAPSSGGISQVTNVAATCTNTGTTWNPIYTCTATCSSGWFRTGCVGGSLISGQTSDGSFNGYYSFSACSISTNGCVSSTAACTAICAR